MWSVYNQRQKVPFLWHSGDVALPMVSVTAALCGLCCIIDKDFLCIAASNIFELETVPSTMMWLHVGYRQLAVLRFFFLKSWLLELLLGLLGISQPLDFASLCFLTSFWNFSAAEAGLAISFVFYPRLTFFFHFFQHSVLRCIQCAGISRLISSVVRIPIWESTINIATDSHMLEYILHPEFLSFTDHCFSFYTIMSELIPVLHVTVLKAWSQYFSEWLHL